MPQIILKGELPSPKQVFQAGCPNCKTVFRFRREEATQAPAARTLTIKCPLPGCAEVVRVEVD